MAITRKRARSVAIGLLLGGALAALFQFLREDFASLPVYSEVPPFELVDQDGSPFSRESLKGKIWVANFIYTRCTDTCPLESAEMLSLQQEFQDKTDLKLISFTVDPGYDTSQVLKAYAERFSARPGKWVFLTGEKDKLADVVLHGFRLAFARKQGLLRLRGILGAPLGILSVPSAQAHSGHPHGDEKEGRIDAAITHSSRFVLVDREFRIRGYYRSVENESPGKLGREKESLERLRQDIRKLL